MAGTTLSNKTLTDVEILDLKNKVTPINLPGPRILGPIITAIGPAPTGIGQPVVINGLRLGANMNSGYITFSAQGINWGAPGDVAVFNIYQWTDTCIIFEVPLPSGPNNIYAIMQNVTATITVTDSIGNVSNSVSILINLRAAFVLSGGGAKGDFQVGAIRYLYEHNILPVGLYGTSVGSINAAKLAEGTTAALEDPNNGLESIWFGLKQNSDMYIKAQWVINLPPDVSGVIDSLINSNGPPQNITLTLGQKLLTSLPFAGNIALQDVINLINDLQQNMSIYVLDPIAKQLNNIAILDPTKIQGSGIQLRIAMTCLEDGQVHYVDQNGNGIDMGVPPPKIDLPTAILGSSAIPAFFNPQIFWNCTWVDGGVKRIVPIDKAISDGYDMIYAILCDPPLPSKAPNNLYSQPTEGIIAIAGRAVEDLLTNSIQEYPINPLPNGVTLIQPSISVHNTYTIDPGLISISMAYGYMRAGEVLAFGSNPQNNPLLNLSDSIINLRVQIWNMENIAMAIGPVLNPKAVKNAQVVLQIRQMKLQLRNLVCQYIQSPNYKDFLPPIDFRSQNELNSIQSLGAPLNVTDYRTWWILWERHNFVSLFIPFTPTNSPWNAFSDDVQTIPPISDAEILNYQNPCTP